MRRLIKRTRSLPRSVPQSSPVRDEMGGVAAAGADGARGVLRFPKAYGPEVSEA